MSKKYNLPKSFTTITIFSRVLALLLFIIIAIGSFYFGIYYQKTTHQGFPNFFCKKWDTICDPNLVDQDGKCAYQTVCVDPASVPVYKSQSNVTYPADLRLVINQAKENLSNTLSLDTIRLFVVSAQTTRWNDGSLGCRQPGKMYIQSPVDGYKIILSDGNSSYEYHGKKGGVPFLCNHPTAP